MSPFTPCAVIPVYNHHTVLPAVVDALRGHDLPVILVDDGSAADCHTVIADLATRDGVECVTHTRNRGKGTAVMSGMARAEACDYSHALQIDADGQHDLADVPRLLEQARQYPQHLISGRPVYDDSIPAIRFYGRYLTHALVWLETLSLSLRDSMCGYRVYPVAASRALIRRVRIGSHMDFDTDIMVRLYWAGTPSRFVPTRVQYPENGLSHFRMWADNARMTWLHLRLTAGMLWRAPRLLRRREPVSETRD